MKLTVFRKPADLLAALLLRSPALPPFVYETSSGWGVPPLKLGFGLDAQQLAGQHGWEMTSCDENDAQKVSTFEVLRGEFTYCDPLHPSSNRTAPAGVRPPSSNDASDNQMESLYILGAYDAAQSQEILDALGDLHTQGVEGAAILLEPAAGECPFRFFWIVRSRRPDFFVTERAARTWYGPVGRGAVEIFVQWPYSLALPVASLNALPWGDGAAYGLLSKDDPEYLVLRRRGDQIVFREIQHVARLTTGPARVATATAAEPPKRPTLNVRIRLIDQPPQSKLADRINEVDREIEAKQLLVDEMRQRIGGEQPPLAALEPLFIYGEREGTGGKIPEDLRRLLIEWSDIEPGLRSLYYMSLKSEQLPKNLFRANSTTHVVTTANALGIGGSGHVGVRLWEYRSQETSCFNLRPEWADFGVRIFTPDHKHCEIYPEMRPGRVAATRLAEALMQTADQAKESIALLLLDREGALHVVRLRVGDFKPLCDAWQWNCRLNVQLDATAVAERLQMSALASTWRSVRSSFLDTVEGEVLRKVKELTAPLDREIASIRRSTEAQRTKIGNLRAVQNDVDAKMADCLRVGGVLAENLNRLQIDSTRAGQSIESVAEIQKQIVELERQIGALRRKLSETALPPASPLRTAGFWQRLRQMRRRGR